MLGTLSNLYQNYEKLRQEYVEKKDETLLPNLLKAKEEERLAREIAGIIMERFTCIKCNDNVKIMVSHNLIIVTTAGETPEVRISDKISVNFSDPAEQRIKVASLMKLMLNEFQGLKITDDETSTIINGIVYEQFHVLAKIPMTLGYRDMSYDGSAQ